MELTLILRGMNFSLVRSEFFYKLLSKSLEINAEKEDMSFLIYPLLLFENQRKNKKKIAFILKKGCLIQN